jgi:hypothetical protein
MAKPKVPRRIRDRERQLRMQVTPPKPVKSHKVLLEIIGGISALLTIAGFLLSYVVPKVSVNTSGSLRSHDPLGSVFYLQNDGALSIHDVAVRCTMRRLEDERGNTLSDVPIEVGPHVALLLPGHKTTLRCQDIFGNTISVRKIKMTIDASYRPSFLWWRKNESFPMEAAKAEDGTWIWKNLPD